MCTIGTGTTVERRRREREAGKLPFAKSNKPKPGKLDRLKQHKWFARRFGIAAGVSSASGELRKMLIHTEPPMESDRVR
jgi:hypothetical protein